MNMTASNTQRLTPQQKLELVQGMSGTSNVTTYARERGVDRSYLYQLRRELEDSALEGWASTTAGRPPREQPAPTIQVLEAENLRLDEKAKVWEARAVVATWILEKLASVNAVKKTSSPSPIFSSY